MISFFSKSLGLPIPIAFSGLKNWFKITKFGEKTSKIQVRSILYFADCISNNVKCCSAEILSRRLKMAATIIGNSSLFRRLFDWVDPKFIEVHVRRSLIHSDVNERLKIIEVSEVKNGRFYFRIWDIWECRSRWRRRRWWRRRRFRNRLKTFLFFYRSYFWIWECRRRWEREEDAERA